ncbi:MAG: leucyl aminopeptidase [Bacillota bacterium]
MKVTVWHGSIAEVKADAVVVNLFEGVKSPGGATGAVDQALGGAISRLIEAGEVTGKAGQAAVVYTLGRLPARKVVVAGLGASGGFGPEGVRAAAGWAMRAAAKGNARTVATIVHGAGLGGLEPGAAAAATVEGSLLAAYAFKELKPAEDSGGVEELILVDRDEAKLSQIEAGAQRGEALAGATALARDLVNRPGNLVTPTAMAQTAADIARRGGLTLEVLERADCERLGMGAFVSVAKGSDEPAKLIVLRYQPGGRRSDAPVALVGKGLTFDSGGISLKPGEGMEGMKSDMAGGAAVLGAMEAVATLKPAVEVIGVIPATENMPSGHASRPGDVVRAMNGKTIEIISTDAEGRMILADAICYAKTQGATKLIDLATLTGACVVALGNVRAGLFSNDDGLAAAVERAAVEAGEKVWRLPVDAEYREQIKSDVAEIKNTGGRPAGAITGALFLAEFAGDTPWVHLDIAGVAMNQRDLAFTPKGATGFGVRTLARLVESMR